MPLTHEALPHVADDFHKGFTYDEEELLSEEDELEEEDERLRQEFEQEPQTPIVADPAPHVEQASRTPRKIRINRGFLRTLAPTGKFHFASPEAPRYLVG